MSHGAIREDAVSMTTEESCFIVIELQAAILLVLSDEETSESEPVKTTSTNLRFAWAQVICAHICAVPGIIEVFNYPKYIAVQYILSHFDSIDFEC